MGSAQAIFQGSCTLAPHPTRGQLEEPKARRNNAIEARSRDSSLEALTGCFPDRKSRQGTKELGRTSWDAPTRAPSWPEFARTPKLNPQGSRDHHLASAGLPYDHISNQNPKLVVAILKTP